MIVSDAPRVVRPQLTVRPLAVAILVLLAAAATSLMVGAAELPMRAVALALVDRIPFVDVDHGLTAIQLDVLWQLRLPRIVLGGLVGASLSSAGAAYQGVFRNPLADPYLLGVAAGAGLGATLAIVAGAGATLVLPLAAFAGASIAVVTTYALSHRGGSYGTTGSLLLAGVAMASFFTAIQTYVQQTASDTVRQVFAWILGRLVTFGWAEVMLMLPFVILAAVVLLGHRRHLDVLAVGEDEAAALGLDVARVRIVVVVAATLATAAAVSVAGLIGFVGIIVPHAIRLMTGASYRILMPLSMLGGAAFMMAADVVARSVVAPAELPIGVITAFVGAPFFVFLLTRSRGVR